MKRVYDIRITTISKAGNCSPCGHSLVAPVSQPRKTKSKLELTSNIQEDLRWKMSNTHSLRQRFQGFCSCLYLMDRSNMNPSSIYSKSCRSRLLRIHGTCYQPGVLGRRGVHRVFSVGHEAYYADLTEFLLTYK